MGYTHYFPLKKVGKKRGLKGLKKEVDKILAEHKDVIQFECDNSAKPVCEISEGKILIRFNGIGEDGHETFYFDSSETDFAFCKTARKDYDIVVCKVLVLLHVFYGTNIEVSSDGYSGYQPKENKYQVNNVVRYEDIDGTWGDALNWYNNYFVGGKVLSFRVDKVYGDKDCYFSYTLNVEK